MNAHRIKTTVDSNGCLLLNDLPFKPGQAVEVVILERSPQQPSEEKDRYPLRKYPPVQYIDPLEPVAEADWEANQ